MNICGNFGCRNKTTLACKCLTSYFCSTVCQKTMWPFHKESCKFSLADIPLAKREILDEKNRFVQLYNIIDALDRMIRIVPPKEHYLATNEEATEEKKWEKLTEPHMSRFASTVMRIDEQSKCKRLLGFTVGPSEKPVVKGEDCMKQLVDDKFPPQIVARTMMFGNSLKFCITICSVIEMLSKNAGLTVLHGCEQIHSFFLAKGRVTTLRPRLVMADWESDLCQITVQEIDTYCILFVPEARFHFEQFAVYGFERAEKIDKRAVEVMESRAELLKKWNEEKAKGMKEEPVVWTPKTAELYHRFGRNCIFVAPAAGEHDEALYADNISIGVPTWFQLKEIYSTKDMQNLVLTDEIGQYVSIKTRQILVDLLDKERATKVVMAAIGEAANTSTSDTSLASTSSSTTATQLDQKPEVSVKSNDQTFVGGIKTAPTAVVAPAAQEK